MEEKEEKYHQNIKIEEKYMGKLKRVNKELTNKIGRKRTTGKF